MPNDVGRANDLLRAWIGRTCEVSRDEFQWYFGFGGGGALSAGCPWRLIAEGRIDLCSGDDGHQFGLPAPVDALAEVRQRVQDARVATVTVAEITCDLAIAFETGAILQLVSDSSGYEAWIASAAGPDGRTTSQMVASGGGGLTIFPS